MIKLINILSEIRVQRPPDADQIWYYWDRLRLYSSSTIGDIDDFNNIGKILGKYINKYNERDSGGFQKYTTEGKIHLLSQEERNALYREFLPYIQKYNISQNINEIKVVGNVSPEQIIELYSDTSNKLTNDKLGTVTDKSTEEHSIAYKYDYNPNHPFDIWLKQLPQSTRNQYYRDLLAFRNKYNIS